MKRLEIRTKVEGIVQDASLDSNALNSCIDQCILYAGTLIDIPALKRIDMVNTMLEKAYVALSGPFGRLKKVKSNTGADITIFPSLELLMDLYPTMDEVGNVEAVALEGSTLWYQKIPEEAETLTILFYKDPTILTDDKAVPKDFPPHLHEALFVHGTAWMILDQVNVEASSQFELSFDEDNRHSGITKLKEWLVKNERHSISGSWI